MAERTELEIALERIRCERRERRRRAKQLWKEARRRRRQARRDAIGGRSAGGTVYLAVCLQQSEREPRPAEPPKPECLLATQPRPS